MGIINKEKILTGLREYHSIVLPAQFPSKETAALTSEIEEMEDNITGMLLKLINGKAEFADFSEALNSLRAKALVLLADTKNLNYKNILIAKFDQLADLLAIAKQSAFKLRPVKLVKVA